MGKSQEIVIRNFFSNFIIEFVFVYQSLIASDTVNHFPLENVAKGKHEGE